MEPNDLIAVARTLAAGGNASNPGGTTDTELRRAVSCAYYAIFHTLCCAYADVMTGPNPVNQLGRQLWNMAYRTLDHGPIRNKCNDSGSMSLFSPNLRRLAITLVNLQQRRHEADYDPGGTFDQTQVTQIIDDAEDALAGFNNTPPDEIRLSSRTSRPGPDGHKEGRIALCPEYPPTSIRP